MATQREMMWRVLAAVLIVNALLIAGLFRRAAWSSDDDVDDNDERSRPNGDDDDDDDDDEEGDDPGQKGNNTRSLSPSPPAAAPAPAAEEEDEDSGSSSAVKPNDIDPENLPPVTFVLPAFNEEKFLAGALDNLAKQEYPRLRFVLVNDASKDKTASIMTEWADKHKEVTIVTHPENKRLPASLTDGHEKSLGMPSPLMSWTSADNYYTDVTGVRQMVHALYLRPEAGFVAADQEHVEGIGVVKTTLRNVERTPSTWALLISNTVGVGAFMVRDWCYHRSGGAFDSTLEGVEDWDSYIRYSESAPIVHLRGLIYAYRHHGGQMTSYRFKEIQESAVRYVSKTLKRLRAPPVLCGSASGPAVDAARPPLDFNRVYRGLRYCRDQPRAHAFAAAHWAFFTANRAPYYKRSDLTGAVQAAAEYAVAANPKLGTVENVLTQHPDPKHEHEALVWEDRLMSVYEVQVSRVGGDKWAPMAPCLVVVAPPSSSSSSSAPTNPYGMFQAVKHANAANVGDTISGLLSSHKNTGGVLVRVAASDPDLEDVLRMTRKNSGQSIVIGTAHETMMLSPTIHKEADLIVAWRPPRGGSCAGACGGDTASENSKGTVCIPAPIVPAYEVPLVSVAREEQIEGELPARKAHRDSVIRRRDEDARDIAALYRVALGQGNTPPHQLPPYV